MVSLSPTLFTIIIIMIMIMIIMVIIIFIVIIVIFHWCHYRHYRYCKTDRMACLILTGSGLSPDSIFEKSISPSSMTSKAPGRTIKTSMSAPLVFEYRGRDTSYQHSADATLMNANVLVGGKMLYRR